MLDNLEENMMKAEDSRKRILRDLERKSFKALVVNIMVGMLRNNTRLRDIAGLSLGYRTVAIHPGQKRDFRIEKALIAGHLGISPVSDGKLSVCRFAAQ